MKRAGNIPSAVISAKISRKVNIISMSYTHFMNLLALLNHLEQTEIRRYTCIPGKIILKIQVLSKTCTQYRAEKIASGYIGMQILFTIHINTTIRHNSIHTPNLPHQIAFDSFIRSFDIKIHLQ